MVVKLATCGSQNGGHLGIKMADSDSQNGGHVVIKMLDTWGSKWRIVNDSTCLVKMMET